MVCEWFIQQTWGNVWKIARKDGGLYIWFGFKNGDTYMHACIHAYMHPSIHPYMHTCIHPYMHTWIHAYMDKCMHACMHASIPYIPYIPYITIHCHALPYITIHYHTLPYIPYHTIPTYIHTYQHTYIPTYIHTYQHTYIHTNIHTYIYIYASYIRIFCVCAYVYICMYIYIYSICMTNPTGWKLRTVFIAHPRQWDEYSNWRIPFWDVFEASQTTWDCLAELSSHRSCFQPPGHSNLSRP